MGITPIEWTDRTWNPIRGCSRVSEGCRNCYAEKIAGRFSKGREDKPKRQGEFQGFAIMTDAGARWTGKVELIESKLEEPLRWKKPSRVFVNSMSDLWHEALPRVEIARTYAVMAYCQWLTFQVLTKRPEVRYDYCGLENDVRGLLQKLLERHGPPRHAKPFRWPLPNVWEGVSVEDPETAAKRIPKLLITPAALRFVSYEPALALVDFTPGLPGIDWIIIGGESGPSARPFDLAWARKTVRDCKAAGVPVFVKQLGSAPIEKYSEGGGRSHRGKDSKGGDWDEWPEDLRIRQFPAHPKP